MSSAPQIVYHYTSQDVLLKIVKSGMLWATDILYMNDSDEFTYATKIAEEVAEFYTPDQRKLLKGVFQELSEGMPWVREFSVYVVSFSAQGDLLSQWRAYCPPYGGVSLGFCAVDLANVAQEHPHNFAFEQCIYDDTEQRRRIQSLFDKTVTDPNINTAQSFCRGEFIKLAPLFKHPSFSEEQEWRLVSSLVALEDSRVQYRAGTSMLTPYIEVPMELAGVLSLDHVFLGPTPHRNLTYLSTLRLLHRTRKEGRLKPIESLPPLVKFSDVPYRSW
jgi:hypothetical protein